MISFDDRVAVSVGYGGRIDIILIIAFTEYFRVFPNDIRGMRVAPNKVVIVAVAVDERYLLRVENFLVDVLKNAYLFRSHVVGEISDGEYAVQRSTCLRGLGRQLEQRRSKICGGVRILLFDMDIADDAECAGDKSVLIHFTGLS